MWERLDIVHTTSRAATPLHPTPLQYPVNTTYNSFQHHRYLRHCIHCMKGFMTNMLHVCRSSDGSCWWVWMRFMLVCSLTFMLVSVKSERRTETGVQLPSISQNEITQKLEIKNDQNSILHRDSIRRPLRHEDLPLNRFKVGFLFALPMNT